MISVILPSYNSQATIRKCLDSLQRQSYQGPMEIILCDSSEDRTPEIVRSEYPEIKYFHFDKKTDPGTARNHGVKNSSGDLILFIDSDCEADRDWAAKIVARHEEYPDVAAIGGAAMNGNDHKDPVAWAGYMGEFREFIPQHPRGFVDHIPTLNISYKRWVFEENGRFDPNFYPQEDLKFNYNLRKKNHKILFDPEIRVHHHHRSGFDAFLGHQLRIGKITSQVLKLLPLSGAKIARNKWLFFLVGPLLPFVKMAKTALVFLTKNPRIILRHPLSLVVFNIGVFYWFWGFAKGVFAEDLKEAH